MAFGFGARTGYMERRHTGIDYAGGETPAGLGSDGLADERMYGRVLDHNTRSVWE